MGERINLASCPLHLGRNIGGTRATIEGAQVEATRWGKPVHILSPRPDDIISRAKKMGVRASKVETTRGVVLVRIEATHD